MEKIKLAENLYMFAQKHKWHIQANTYLLKGKPNILIDAGFFIDEKVDLVILTHCHVDHCKFAREYQKRSAKVAASKEAAKELSEASEIVSSKLARLLFGTKLKQFKVDKILTDGEIIDNGNFKLKVLKVPGHTPGSIALFDEEKRILFTGDTWNGRQHGTWNHPGGNFNELQNSIDILRNLKPKLLCPGHGDVIGKS